MITHTSLDAEDNCPTSFPSLPKYGMPGKNLSAKP
jgi:hypothetical protein